MTQINWNALQSFDIGGAFNQGMQAGQQRRREQETDNALRALIANPNDTNVVNDLAKYDPGMAYRVQGQQQQAQAATHERDVKVRAAQGDPEAIAELAGIDWNAWKGISGPDKDKLKARNDFLGQAALRISQMPVGQQAQAWDSYVQQGVQLGYSDLAEYQGKYSPDAVQALIANAGQVAKLFELEKPELRNVAYGDTLLDVKPLARGEQPRVVVQPYGQGQQPAVPNGPDAEDIAMLRQNPNAAAQFDEVFGPGAAQRALGGGGGNATGNFPR